MLTLPGGNFHLWAADARSYRPSMTTTPVPRLRPGLIVLLTIVSIANAFGLVLAIEMWHDEVSHGGDYVGLAVFTTGLTVLALVGIGGAWARRDWGPPLYFGAQAVGFLLALVVGVVGFVSFMPLLLAGVLWAMARSS